MEEGEEQQAKTSKNLRIKCQQSVSNNSEDIDDVEEQIVQASSNKEHGQSSRTRALRLKENDVIVAIDGTVSESIDNMVDLLSSGEEDDTWLLTIWRNGKFFEIFTRGPLGGVFDFTRPEESQMIMELFQKRKMGEKKEYRIFEALRDINRVVDVYDTTHSQTAVILPLYGFYSKKCGNLYWLSCVCILLL